MSCRDPHMTCGPRSARSAYGTASPTVDTMIVLGSLIGAEDLKDLVWLNLEVRFGHVLVSNVRASPARNTFSRDPTRDYDQP